MTQTAILSYQTFNNFGYHVRWFRSVRWANLNGVELFAPPYPNHRYAFHAGDISYDGFYEPFPPYYSTFTGSVVEITSILFKDSINSSVTPLQRQQWVYEFEASNQKFLERRPKPPRVIVVRPLRLKPIKPLRRLVLNTDDVLKSPDGRPWRPKKVEARIRKMRLELESKNKELKRLYDRALKRRNDAIAAHLVKTTRITLINEKRQEKWKLRLHNWDVARSKREKSFIMSRKRLKRYDQDHPYQRLHLVRDFGVSTGSGYSYMTTGYPDAYGNPVNDGGLGTAQVRHLWVYDYLPAAQVATEGQRNAFCSSTNSLVLQLLEPEIEALSQKGRRKVYSKFANQKINLGNMFAERHQTLNLLGTTLRRLFDLVTLKKGVLKNMSEFIHNPRKWADEILAFKFGVEPLVSDFNTAVKFLSIETDPLVATVRTKDSVFTSVARGGMTFNGQITVRYCVKANLDNVMFQKLNEWGLTNPLSVAWELTPWSFVVDWLIPIGRLIESWTALTGLSFSTGTRHVTLKGTFRKMAEISPSDADVIETTQNWRLAGHWTGIAESRTVLIDFPDFPALFIKNPVSDTHNLLAICLIIQKIK